MYPQCIGCTGLTGATGLQGLQGLSGNTGLSGKKGLIGLTGSTGLSTTINHASAYIFNANGRQIINNQDIPLNSNSFNGLKPINTDISIFDITQPNCIKIKKDGLYHIKAIVAGISNVIFELKGTDNAFTEFNPSFSSKTTGIVIGEIIKEINLLNDDFPIIISIRTPGIIIYNDDLSIKASLEITKLD